MRQPGGQYAGALVVPDAGQYAGVLITGAVGIAKRHPVKVSLNFLGLALLFGFGGLSLTAQDREAAIALLPSDSLMRAESRALVAMEDARIEYNDAKGWFWRCDAACQKLRARFEQKEAAWKAARAQVESGVTASRQRLGLFSTEGIGAAKDTFWRAFAGGTAYAKRATLYDAIFAGIRFSMRRDESWVEFALQLLFRLLSNLTVGIISGVISFWFAAWGLVRDFGYSVFSPKGLLFLAGCSLVGASFVVSSVVLMWTTASLGVVAAANVATLALQNEAARRRGPRQGGGRLHYE